MGQKLHSTERCVMCALFAMDKYQQAQFITLGLEFWFGNRLGAVSLVPLYSRGLPNSLITHKTLHNFLHQK